MWGFNVFLYVDINKRLEMLAENSADKSQSNEVLSGHSCEPGQ